MTQWGIVHRLTPNELHRGPMTLAEANAWVEEFESDGGVVGAFLVARRTVTPWRPNA